MWSDFRYGFRQLVKNPAFTLVAVATLALGIGANTAIFSVVEGTLLRPLPFPHSDRLFRLYETSDESGARGGSMNLSGQTVLQWSEHGGEIFDGVAAATGLNVTVGSFDGNFPRSLQASRVTSNFFSVLGLLPALGRNFTPEEDKPNGPAVVIISDDFWRQYLGARPDVLDTTLTIDGVPHTIIGVMPKTFRHPYRSDLWMPLALTPPTPGQPLDHYLYGVARLRAGLTNLQAVEAVRRMCSAINETAPSQSNAHAVYLPPLRDSFVIDLRPKLVVIIIAALCALLIAAANFGGLLFTRVIEREGEFAVRAALGASWQRLAQQQLVQALILSVLGTLTGLLIAHWITPVLVAMSPEGSDMTGSAMREFDYTVRFDWPVFAFAASATLIVGLGFGLLPAVRASRADLRGAINSTARGSTLDRGARRLLGALVVGELAIAAALLIASLAAGQYFKQLLNEPWGFSTDHRTAFNLVFSDRIFRSAAAKENALDQVLGQVRAIPGVKTATVTGPSPMNAPRDLMGFNVEGAAPPEPRHYYLSYVRATVPDYFKNIDEPLLQGRDFSNTDTATSPPVCIVSQSFAKRFWPNESPIGKRVKWGLLEGSRPWLIIVGVVADMKAIPDLDDGEVIGMIVRPFSQLFAADSYDVDEITFVLQTNDDRIPIEPAIRAALARINSQLAPNRIVSLGEASAQSRSTERFVLTLVSLFGGLGLTLAAVGLYGLLSLHVARREREFGIRTALGATATHIVRLVARQGISLIGGGLAVGAFVTWAIVHIVRAQWSAMPAPTILSSILTVIVLATAAFIACFFPARRATHVDPIQSLRME